MKRISMRVFVLVFACLAGFTTCRADELAAVTGLVTDPAGRSVPGVTVIITNLATNVASRTVTNDQGIYRISSLQPGIYRVTLDKDGFKSIVKSGVELHVQDVASINFELQIGSVNETVTVEAGGLVINTTDATVSTVVDRNFAENLPMNGRSFQTLVQLTPGVVTVPTNVLDEGQFSVNGQRAASNYWTVDGVSANTGIGSGGGNSNAAAGTLGSFSALGGTNSLVSIDAMQEFRIQTSTYAPEFGRVPGAQISIATRSGTNQFHGTLFDYLRNDALDANNWFNTSVTPALPKAKERQNDFGGTLGGPIFKNRTFFFFSYEGLRLRLPQTVISTVPDLGARQAATPAMQPFLNAYPLPNGPDNPATGIAQFNSSFSSSATLDSSALRLDHRVSDKLSLFARYNYSPSEIAQRGGALAPSVVTPIDITTQTATVGAAWSISASTVNDVRFNYSRTNAKSRNILDNFGGAVPPTSLPFPSPLTSQSGQLIFAIIALRQGVLEQGANAENAQRQINLVDSVSLQKNSHALKFGVDYRRLTPVLANTPYVQTAIFIPVTAAESGNVLSASVQSNAPVSLLFRNLGVFAQDTWRATPRLTLTYGLRWDVDFVPGTLQGPSLPAVTEFNVSNFSQLGIAPAGASPYATSYTNVAPRLGAAYQLRNNPDWQTVVRGGFGIFYDLASTLVGTLVGSQPPFGAPRILSGPGLTFPLSASNSAPVAIPPAATVSNILAVNPNLKLPYTWQWNGSLEQALGKQQVLTLSYIGAAGRRLLQTIFVTSPTTNPAIATGVFVENSATSDYDALQVQFQRRLSRGLQALASYSWAHSIDTGSAGSAQLKSNTNVPGTTSNRGPSDFDIRHAFSAGVTYQVPAPVQNRWLKPILQGWSLQNTIQARSAPPVEVLDASFRNFAGVVGDVRPDLVPGQPLYLFGPQFPGGKAFNPAAFTDPPNSGGQPLRQGNVPRNFLRGFGATQWDAAVHRDFPLAESIKLQFRAEMFNVLNHPNFGQPSGSFRSGSFGTSLQTLNQSFAGSGTLGAGGFSPLYQIGGPRSIQFALKLMF